MLYIKLAAGLAATLCRAGIFINVFFLQIEYCIVLYACRYHNHSFTMLIQITELINAGILNDFTHIMGDAG